MVGTAKPVVDAMGVSVIDAIQYRMLGVVTGGSVIDAIPYRMFGVVKGGTP